MRATAPKLIQIPRAEQPPQLPDNRQTLYQLQSGGPTKDMLCTAIYYKRDLMGAPKAVQFSETAHIYILFPSVRVAASNFLRLLKVWMALCSTASKELITKNGWAIPNLCHNPVPKSLTPWYKELRLLADGITATYGWVPYRLTR
jgi:hypothetical protein